MLNDPTITCASDRYRSYENANLVSSKQITTFSDFRLPLNHPDHLTLPEYVEYLRDYMVQFQLDERLKLSCRVVHIRRSDNGHIVEYIDNSGSEPTRHELYADYIAVCSGLHVTPSSPDIPGIEYVLNPKPALDSTEREIPRQVYHSSEYKSRSQLAGRRVMVLGTGETGHDLAYEAAKAGATEVALCTRGEPLSNHRQHENPL